MIPILFLALFQPAQAAPLQGLRCRTGSPLIIEKETLTGIAKQHEIVLWMCGAEKHDQDFDPGAYTCP